PAPWAGGQGANTNPDASKTINFAPTSPGTYIFYARAQTQYYTSWTTYAQITITVTAAPIPTATFTQSPATTTPSQQVTITWSTSNVTSCTFRNDNPSTGLTA